MLDLIKNHPRIYLFSFITFIFSCVGQTYLLAWFNPELIKYLEISQTELSTVYSLATFAASFMLPFFGKFLDRTTLARFCFIVAICISFGLTLLGFTFNIYILFIGYFIVRSFGQITLGLAASTTITKKFGRHRGKSLSITQIGRSVGESFWPIFIISLMGLIGWRNTFFSLSATLLFIFVPVVYLLARNINFKALYEENEKAINKNTEKQITKKEFYKDRKSFLVLFANSMLPFVLTGLFFLQSSVGEYKGWSLKLLGTAFTMYAVVQFATSFISGLLVDKFTARRMLGLSTFPLLLAFLTLLFLDGQWVCYLYYAFVGLAVGLSGNVRNSFWAEAYGTKSLGMIKSIDSAYLVKGTAFSPIVFAYIIDHYGNLDQLLYFLIGMTTLGGICYIWAKYLYDPQRLENQYDTNI